MSICMVCTKGGIDASQNNGDFFHRFRMCSMDSVTPGYQYVMKEVTSTRSGSSMPPNAESIREGGQPYRR
jgi:hypothetical protein